MSWIIVENGSKDSTRQVAEELMRSNPWCQLVVAAGEGRPERGAPIVRALEVGVAKILELPDPPEVIVNVDADVTMGDRYFELLLREFEGDSRLGIASGSAWELRGGVWEQRFVTKGTVWGATRAYRTECLRAVWPLERRHGWDGVDQLKARARGWDTRTLVDLPFRHHRSEGERDSSAWAHWVVNGDTAWFMGYRPSYLLLRSLHHALASPAAVGLVYGYVRAAVLRSPRLSDPGARALIRDQQRLRNVLQRRREATGVLEAP
jgi:hypothetical protein